MPNGLKSDDDEAICLKQKTQARDHDQQRQHNNAFSKVKDGDNYKNVKNMQDKMATHNRKQWHNL